MIKYYICSGNNTERWIWVYIFFAPWSIDNRRSIYIAIRYDWETYAVVMPQGNWTRKRRSVVLRRQQISHPRKFFSTTAFTPCLLRKRRIIKCTHQLELPVIGLEQCPETAQADIFTSLSLQSFRRLPSATSVGASLFRYPSYIRAVSPGLVDENRRSGVQRIYVAHAPGVRIENDFRAAAL